MVLERWSWWWRWLEFVFLSLHSVTLLLRAPKAFRRETKRNQPWKWKKTDPLKERACYSFRQVWQKYTRTVKGRGQASLAWNPCKFLFPSCLASTELAEIAVRSIKVIKVALKIIVRPIMAQKQVIQVEVEADAGSSSFSSGCKFLVTVLKHSF